LLGNDSLRSVILEQSSLGTVGQHRGQHRQWIEATDRIFRPPLKFQKSIQAQPAEMLKSLSIKCANLLRDVRPEGLIIVTRAVVCKVGADNNQIVGSHVSFEDFGHEPNIGIVDKYAHYDGDYLHRSERRSDKRQLHLE